jgi:hypothetical protein
MPALESRSINAAYTSHFADREQRVPSSITSATKTSLTLAKHVRTWGVRGLIQLVRATIAAPWLRAEAIQRIATALCQLRLE